jgi:hypothetical protein
MATTFQLRTYRRLPMQGQGTVFFAGHDVEGKGMLWNLSVTGCRITTHALALGLEVSLLIELPNKRALIVPRARVAWSLGNDHGLELVATVPGDDERLQSFIQAWQPLQPVYGLVSDGWPNALPAISEPVALESGSKGECRSKPKKRLPMLAPEFILFLLLDIFVLAFTILKVLVNGVIDPEPQPPRVTVKQSESSDYLRRAA